MNLYERKLVLLTSFAHCLCHMYMVLFPPLLPLLKSEFSGNYLILGLVSNVSYFAFGFGALPSGYLSDRLGSKNILLIFLFGIGLSALFLGLSSSFLTFAIFLAFLGIFAGLYHPAGLSLISKEVGQRGKALGFHGMMGNLGIATAPFCAAAIASIAGWRTVYLMFAIPGILLGAFLFYLPTKSPHLASSDVGGDSHETLANGLGILPLVLLFSIAALNGFSYRGVITFLPVLMSENMHINLFGLQPLTMGGLMTTLPLLIGVFGQYLGGYLADRPKIERSYFVILLVSFPLLFLLGATSNLILLASAIGFALFYFATQPIGNSLLASYTSNRYRGMSYGLFFFMGFGMGSFATSFSGYVADRLGVQAVFMGLGVFLFCGFILSFVLMRLVNKQDIQFIGLPIDLAKQEFNQNG